MATQPKKKNTVLRAEGEITQQRLLLLVHDIKCRRIFIEKLEVPRDAHLWEESSIRNADCFQCLLDVAHIRLDVTFLFFTWKLRGCSALDSLNHRGASHSGAAAGALPGSSLGHSHSGVCEPDLMRLLQWCLLRVMTPDMMVSAVDLLRPRSRYTARTLASARHLNSLAVSQVQPSQKVLWPSRTDSGPRGQRKVRPVF